MSFVSHSARTATANNYNTSSTEDKYNNDNTTCTTASATTIIAVLRLGRSESESGSRSNSRKSRSNSRKRGSSPTAASSSRNGGRLGILKKQRTGEASALAGEGGAAAEGMEYCVPAAVPAIIENIDDATIPEKRYSELSPEEFEALKQREQAIPRRRRPGTLRRRRWTGPRSMRC